MSMETTKFTAWDLIGTDRLVKIVGGRTVYEQVAFEDSGRATKVRLSRLVQENPCDYSGCTYGSYLRQINRYVDADTPMEIVEG
jgi:hypothetical protein